MSNRERILVVDEVSDTAEVLQAVLEPRGLTVNRVRRLDLANSTGAASRPAVVVLNVESTNGTGPAEWNDWRDVPLVIIGTAHLPVARSTPSAECPPAARRVLSKPFQFAELVAAIEAMIVRPPPFDSTTRRGRLD